MKFTKRKFIRNNSGMIIADFLFAFTMVLGIGIFMFALTFSLATIEVAQYIVWSTARNYSASQVSDIIAAERARTKFEALIAQFPLLTNSEGTSSWFELSKEELKIGELDTIDSNFNIMDEDKKNNFRQPWTGVSTNITLKLFGGLQVPFLGKVTSSPAIFTFPVRAFLIRNVSQTECLKFFYLERPSQMQKLEDEKLAPAAFGLGTGSCSDAGCGEDNGC